MLNNRYVLRYKYEDGEWQEMEVASRCITIGRTGECDLILNYPEVSRCHCRIDIESDAVWLCDLGSTNGVYLDGGRIPPNGKAPLKPDQEFSIGPFRLALIRLLENAGGASPAEALPSKYRLLYRQGCQGAWGELPLPLGEVVLGRGPDCFLTLDEKEISRHHARLVLMPEEVWLYDLGSTNGTQLEEQPLAPRRGYALKPGQPFSLGSFTLKVEQAERAAGLETLSATVSLSSISSGPQPVQPVQAFNLTVQNMVSIGRASDNDLVLKHPLISHYHAQVERLGSRTRVINLQSTNGVLVNGERIDHEKWVEDGDTIRIGPYTLVLAGQSMRPQLETGLRLETLNLQQRVSKNLNLLQNISLTIQPMEFVALVGMSGSGKTTLLNALSGFRPASHGSVLVNGVDLYKHYDTFRNDIGYVPQKDIVHMELTPEIALDYVAKLRMPPDTSPAERRSAVLEVLDDLDLTERKDVPIGRLSGGQLKRVSIGVELLTKPRLFFLDEPTSGLDPGTEYEMMRLLRRLADQGRTIILITHATKNVNYCDKVIFLARGGHVAFFGPPEEALAYFDQYRTPRERRLKEMEFDDIYRILSDEQRGRPLDWGQRFEMYRSQAGQAASAAQAAGRTRSQADLQAGPRAAHKPRRARVSALRQFWILSARNLKILTQDRVSLALMLALAPIIGLTDAIWGSRLYDPVDGDPIIILTMWFMAALITALVGALSSVREIVKEIDIYKRERAVNLMVFPYVLSKVWVGVVLASYQAGILLLTKFIFIRPVLSSNSAYLSLYVTLFLGTLCGYLIGLAISAGAPNQNAAILLIVVALVPQFLFAGALLPLDLIPKGEYLSLVMPTRWIFESFVLANGVGAPLANDPCWQLPEEQRSRLSDKSSCDCMGANIFTRCTTFPAILSPEYYDEAARRALGQPQPVEPLQPTAFPYPTALPSPTPLPTPTLKPSPTPYPTPADPRELTDYMDLRQEQGAAYQDQILEQFDEYRAQSEQQGQAYSGERTLQGDEYAALRQAQGDEYSQAMRAYGDRRAEWQEKRDKAIGSAEATLKVIYENYGRAFQGKVTTRWAYLGGILAGLVVLLLFFQKRKDVV